MKEETSLYMFQAVDPPAPPPPNAPPPPAVGWVVGWWGGVVGWLDGWVVGWLGGWVVGVWFGSWFRLGGLVWGWFRVGLRWVSGGFGVWVDLGLGLGLRRGCRVVCERCGGVDSRGERGSLGPKLQGSRGQHPQHCQHHPQDADDAGEWKDHTIGGGGYVAQGLVHICILDMEYMEYMEYIEYIYINNMT